MSTYRDGEETAKGWKARKLYLSDAAIAMLMEHCRGTPLTMSAYVDGMIKEHLSSAYEEAKRVIDEGQRQIAELTAPPRTITTQDGTKLPAVEPTKRGTSMKDWNAANKRAFQPPYAAPRAADDKPKQPTKKDFKIDI